MKKWYQSKTIIFNVLFGLFAVVPVLLDMTDYVDFEPSNEVVTVVGAVVAIVNVLLRSVTDKKVIL